ncbi:MAG: DUF721 domain-containing protein [Muribaculaceae bacterium]
MKRSEAQTVGEIARQLFKYMNLEDQMLRQQILDIWPKVVGPVIAKRTVERYILGDKLVVSIVSAPIRNELMMHRSRLLESLNKAVGKNVISDVIIK